MQKLMYKSLDSQIMLMSFFYLAVEKTFRSISQISAKIFVLCSMTFLFLSIYSYPGTKTRALNLASYNYLGFAENSGPCSEAAEQAVRSYGVAGCSPRNEYGERIFLH